MKHIAAAIIQVVLLLLTAAGAANASTKFETKCTTPSEPANFVTSPDSRGTLDILWSGLFTIFACTWTIQHLNIPEQRRGRDPGRWGDFKWKVKSLWRKTKWMLITAIAPEIILAKAIGDYWLARKSVKEMKRFATEDGVEWTLAHGFYANMGGFVACPNPETHTDGPTRSSVQQSDLEVGKQSNADSEYSEPGIGLQTIPETESPQESLIRKNLEMNQSGKIFALTAGDIHWLRNEGILQRLPDISTEELNDKGKGDAFVKIIALVQVVFSCLQVIVRVTKGVAISQLELAVVAFSVCAICTYIALLHKPQNVQTPSRPVYCDGITFSKSREAGHDLLRDVVDVLSLEFDQSRTIIHGWYQNKIPNDAVPDNSVVGVFFGTLVAGALFGGIHVAGWDLQAPTPTEQTLWRISVLALTICTIASGLIYLIMPSVAPVVRFLVFPATSTLCAIFTFYVLARVFILVEIFRSLYFLPADAYVSTWASNVPHVS